ncbi:MAG: transporter substrate-binding domain-containing protein [Synergistaceae bacterium]|nr:transporter substrate-binding domain-containing protein [Synergistaceae bacterium]
MRKILLASLLVICCAGMSFSAPIKTGMLSPVGLDENGVIEWMSKIAPLEGQPEAVDKENSIAFYENLTSLLMALNAGKVDKISLTSMCARYIAARNENLNYVDYHNNAVIGYSIAVPESKRNMLMGINLAIFDMKADGTLAKLMRKYILELGNNDPEPVTMPVIYRESTFKIAVTGDIPPMDCILSDGTPAGFNTAFLAELSKRIKKNFELVNIDTGARETALSSGRVDMLFWSRSVYNEKGDRMPYPLDNFTGVAVSEPYLLDSRAALEVKK